MQMFFSELVFVIGQFFTSNIDNDNKLSSEVNLFVVTTKPAFFAVKQTFIHEAQRAREESNYRPIICEKKGQYPCERSARDESERRAYHDCQAS